MAYQALYRKYRPQTFEDVCGRDTIVRTIKNQINNGRIGHSYLFCGTRGTGKTTIAKIFAKAVNCENPQDGNPCGECASCRAISEDANLNVVEMDAASNNSVEDIRAVIEQVSYSPTQGKYRVFIIDEVHMLSTSAFNALLKTLEEPPSYAVFILATTEPNRLPLTILSRCQRYDFGRLTSSTIAERLKSVAQKEGLKAEDEALRYIAGAADGSMRDGLSILDQCNAFNYGNDVLTYDRVLEILGAVDTRVFSRLFRCTHHGDAKGALKVLDDILGQGRELIQFVTDYIGYLRNVMLLKASEETAAALDVSKENLALMLEDARSSEMSEDIRYIDVFSALTEQIRYSGNRRVLTEAAIIRLCEPSMAAGGDLMQLVDSLTERVRSLEQQLTDTQRALAGRGSLVIGTAGAGAGAEGNSAAGAGAPEGGLTEPVKTAKKKLPSAIPEDVKAVAAKWNALIGAIPPERHMMKLYLMQAVPSVDEGGGLIVLFTNFIGAECFIGKDHDRAADNRRYFENYLEERTGRHVPVTYKLLDNNNEFAENYVDIRSLVNMDIGEEDEPVRTSPYL